MNASLRARLSAAWAMLRGRVPVAPTLPNLPARPAIPDLSAMRADLEARAKAAQQVADQARAAAASLQPPKM